MADCPDVAGSTSGVLVVVQFLIGMALAPIVGAFGTHTAMPMSIVIAGFAVTPWVATRLLGRAARIVVA
jgi:DHA1 family bicyclomycin/chloramphenicol resistance-like MFS transporter